MANPLRDLIFGAAAPGRRDLLRAEQPRRGFRDVVLPPATLRALEYALAQIRKHDLIFREWGLAERHSTGLGLAFNFAGAPGTGKTVCAEAIAHALGRKLLVVDYAEMESMWAGESAKNVASVFRSAGGQDAVLFFDEADAIAARRFGSTQRGYEREANATVNVLLRELERFGGVVIFATNLAANFDPAFERRIRTHILFEMPGPAEREQIWQVQLHSRRTPLAADVDFAALGARYEATGGDIKNAVLKAAQIASTEPGPDADKRIHQRHFEQGMEDVLAAKRVMSQSLFDGDGTGDPGVALARVMEEQGEVQQHLIGLAGRLADAEDTSAATAELLRRLESRLDAAEARDAARGTELEGRLVELQADAGRRHAEGMLALTRAADQAAAEGARIARWSLLAAAAALLAALGAVWMAGPPL